MKLRARTFPHSSIVGGGLTLLAEDGRAAFIVSFCGTTAGIRKEETEALSKQFAAWVEEHGLEVPDRE